MPETFMGEFWSWLPFTVLLKLVLEGNTIANCRILAASTPSVSAL